MAVVTVSVRDARAAPSDRLWIQSVYRDYLDDLNPGTGLFPMLGEVGHREPDQIAHWFGDPHTYPLIILKGSERVGFARVVRAVASAAQPGHRVPHGGILRGSQPAAPRHRPDRGAADPQPFRRTLGDHRVPAQRRGGELLARAWSRATRRGAIRNASSTAKCTRCSIPRSRARRRRLGAAAAAAGGPERALAQSREPREPPTAGSVLSLASARRRRRTEASRQAL